MFDSLIAGFYHNARYIVGGAFVLGVLMLLFGAPAAWGIWPWVIFAGSGFALFVHWRSTGKLD